MKKIYIAVAALAAVTLFSCQQEQSFNDEKLGENTLVLSLQGAPSTRSMETNATIKKGETIELGTDEEGNMFILEETIQDLNEAWAPATKGTPVYTENVGVLYEKMGVRAGSSNYEFYSMDNSEGSATGTMVDGGWRYQGAFTWAQDAYDFYFWMPTTDNGITGTPTYGETGDDLSITFSYESKKTAADQKDLIFAARNITKAEAQGKYRVNGVPVLFNHALTGVKFAIKNYDATKKITIKSVSFNGLYDSGTCTIIPAKENNYKDKPTTEYSSGDGRVTWPAATLKKSGDPINSDTFGAPVDFNGTSFDSKGNYPESFGAAGNMQNLNDADASQTFWLIPQTLTDAVTLTIVYTFGSDKEQTWVIDFGEIVAAKGDAVWKAGQLRTYTLRVNDVNVTITDQFTTAEKNNVQIKNTGNTAAFIRAAIIGQWVDDDNQPVFGFTDYVGGVPTPTTIPSWHQDFVNGSGYFGSFTNLALSTRNWVKNSADGYYYYTVPVEPDKYTNALFDKYTIVTEHIPPMYVGGQYKNCHLLIEVATQAISAKNPDGSYRMDGNEYDYMGAWNEAKSLASQASYVTTASN